MTMRVACLLLAVVSPFILALTGVPVAADIADRSWVFTQPGNDLGWLPKMDFTASGVDAGYWWGVTSDSDARMQGPDSVNLAAHVSHYLSLRMRLVKEGMQSPAFGAATAKLYWRRTTDADYAEDRVVNFKVYGTTDWKTYDIPLGIVSGWNGTIRRLRIDPCTVFPARVEIAYIKIMRDQTPPEFELKNFWNPSDGERMDDPSPTIVLRDYWDNVSGVNGVAFFRRPGDSTSESAWVLSGSDADTDGGVDFEYPALPPGKYDLGVRVYDKAGNYSSWLSGPGKIIEDIEIVTDLPTSIDVDASADLGPAARDVGSNNYSWYEWKSIYNHETGRVPDALESKIEEMGIPILRYPGGCDASVFYWKRSIGPVGSRPGMPYGTGCNADTNTWAFGPATIGLDEFLRFCESRSIAPMIILRFRWPGCAPIPGYDGADPYAEALADAADLVEYCNSPNDGSNPNGGVDWAATRAANGHAEPYNVKLFEVGNEPWGPDPFGSPGGIESEKASIYGAACREFIERMKGVDPTVRLAPVIYHRAGRNINYTNPTWGQVAMELVGSMADAYQDHPYYPYEGWQTDLDLLYDVTMATPRQIDRFIDNQRLLVRMFAPEKYGRAKLWLTEWNINYNWWYDPSQGRINTYHTRSLKAGIAAADTYRIFLENQDMVESTQWWHMWGNSPWSCIWSDNTRVNPIYHVLRMFNSHFGSRIVKSKVTGSPNFDFVSWAYSGVRDSHDLKYMTAIASISTDGQYVFLIVINKHRTSDLQATVNISNFATAGPGGLLAEIWEMNGPDVHDTSHPENIVMTESSALLGESFDYTFPAHSVTSFRFEAAPVEVGAIGTARQMAPGSLVQITGKPVSARISPDVIYIEEAARASGIRIEQAGSEAVEGNRADVSGRLQITDAGEPYIAATDVSADTSTLRIVPMNISQRNLAGPGVDATGLLVRVWGVVTSVAPGEIYISDGSGLVSRSGKPGLRVVTDAAVTVGDYVRVDGAASRWIAPGATKSEPVILTRREEDLEVIAAGQ